MDIIRIIEDVAKGSNDRPVEDVTIVDSGELPLDVDSDGKEDFDDEGAHTVSLPDADSVGKAPKPSTLGTPLGESSTYTVRYTIAGLTLFAIATMIFVLTGGLRWLRRRVARRHRGRYHKVDDEDPEK